MFVGIFFHTVGGWFGPLYATTYGIATAPCILIELDWADGNGIHTEYLSNLGYITGESDTPPNTVYLDLILSIPTISARIDSDLQLGDLVIFNLVPEGGSTYSLSDWILRSWHGHEIRMYYGDSTWSRSQFLPVVTGIIDSVSMDGQGMLSFSLADRGLLLQNRIAKDYGFYGKAFNFEPVYTGEGQADIYTIDTVPVPDYGNKYFYPSYFASMGVAFSDNRGVFQITNVRDNGVSVVFTPLTGSTRFELDIPPAGNVTVDAIKQEHYSAGAVMYAMAVDASIPESYLDKALLEQATAGVGYVIGKEQTVNYIDMLKDIAMSAGGYLQWGWSGKLEFYFIDPTKHSLMSFGIDDMTGDGLKIDGAEDPLMYLKLGYKKNWKVQDYNSLAGLVQIDSSPYTVEYQYLTYDGGTTARYPLPLQQSVDTFIADVGDAQAESDRRLGLRPAATIKLSFDYFGTLFNLKIGTNVKISYPLLGWNNYVCSVIGINIDPNANKTSLTLWRSAYVYNDSWPELDQFPLGFYDLGTNLAPRWVVDKTVSKFGHSSVKIDGSTALDSISPGLLSTSTFAGYSSTYTFTPGVKYTLYFWYKTLGSVQAYAGGKFNYTNSLLQTDSPSLDPSFVDEDGWVHVKVNFTGNAEIYKGHEIWFIFIENHSGTLWIDGFSVSQRDWGAAGEAEIRYYIEAQT